MSRKNGMSDRVVAYVAAHPGCTRAELLAGLGVTDLRWAIPTYCAKEGMIHPAGPRGSTRYYPSEAQAAAAHERLVALAAQRRMAKRRAAWVQDNARKRARRHAAGGRAINTCPGRHSIKLDAGVTLAQDVRITIAPPMRDRWAA